MPGSATWNLPRGTDEQSKVSEKGRVVMTAGPEHSRSPVRSSSLRNLRNGESARAAMPLSSLPRNHPITPAAFCLPNSFR